jgi:hypothetical protein
MQMDKHKNRNPFFYMEDCYFIKLHLIYINKNNNMEMIKEEIYPMKIANLIEREEITEIIKKNRHHNNKIYSIMSILQFNINLEPNDVVSYIQQPQPQPQQFIKEIKQLSSVSFTKTINMFQDLNDLFFIFYEKTHSQTKKIYIHSLRKTIKNKRQ